MRQLPQDSSSSSPVNKRNRYYESPELPVLPLLEYSEPVVHESSESSESSPDLSQRVPSSPPLPCQTTGNTTHMGDMDELPEAQAGASTVTRRLRSRK